MTDYLSNLPIELIDKILNDVPSFDILKSLCLDLLFISSSLKYLCLHLVNFHDISRIDLRGEQISSIENLILGNISMNLSHIYSITPSLRTLDTTINPYYFNCTEHFFPPQQLRQLSIKLFHGFRFSTIERLLYQMTSLVQLTIIAYNIYNSEIDGVAWEQILTNIITFKFLFRFHEKTWNQEPIGLEMFSTPFWLENKHWHIQYDRCTVSGFSLLYTTPYIDDTYPWEYIKGPIITKSPGPQILSFPNINHLLVTSTSPTNTEILYRFTKLQQLFVKDIGKSFYVLLNDIVPYIDISNITEFSINSHFPIDSHYSKLSGDFIVKFLFTMSHLRSISVPIDFLKLLFLYRWPNINRLEISFHICPAAARTQKQITSDEIDILYYSFNHIEYIEFDYELDVNIIKLINNIPITICCIVIYQPVNVTADTFHGFITREWLEQNTRLCNFLYSCNKQNTVTLWV
ncbi:unnamed protein product [Rotaria sordida]|uniref:F-box domain-containing protein n=1 Tax=Rotaria sordida TaxID=392033 RepID=A0A819HFA7_9BILA|nr:unnamed protein product [Rotaria sordida]